MRGREWMMRKWSNWADILENFVPVFHPSTMLNLSPACDSGGLKGGLKISTFATPKAFEHEVNVGKHRPGTVKRSGHIGTKITRIWCSPRGGLVWGWQSEMCISLHYDKCSVRIMREVRESCLWVRHIGSGKMREFSGLIWSKGSLLLFAILCFQITFSDLLCERGIVFTTHQHIIVWCGLNRPVYL